MSVICDEDKTIKRKSYEYISVPNNRIKICQELNDKYFKLFEENVILVKINYDIDTDKYIEKRNYNFDNSIKHIFNKIVELTLKENSPLFYSDYGFEPSNNSMIMRINHYITNKNIKELKDYKNESENKFNQLYDQVTVIKKINDFNELEKLNKLNEINELKEMKELKETIYDNFKELKHEYDYKFKNLTNKYEKLKENINYMLMIFSFITIYNLIGCLLSKN